MTAPTPTPKSNVGIRKWWYIISGVLAAVMPILYQSGILDAGQAVVGGAVGGVGAITAGAVTHRQQKEGLHDPPLSPIDAITQAIPQVLDQAAQAQANVNSLRQVTGDFLSATTGSIPVVGPVVAQANSLTQQALDQILNPLA
jgi:hypothetical protein